MAKKAPPSNNGPIRISDVIGLQAALDSINAQLQTKANQAHTHKLNDLTDVTLTTVAEGEVLSVTGVAWTNVAPPERPPPVEPPIEPVEPPSGARSLLTQQDFTYLGAFTIEDTSLGGTLQRTGYSRGALAGRRVNGEVRLFLTGSYSYPWASPIYEYTPPPASSWSQEHAHLPAAACVKDWSAGDHALPTPLYPHGQPVYSADGATVKGLIWDDEWQGLWYGYIANYNVGPDHDPSIGFIAINDTTGVATGYGPWRHQQRMPLTGGYGSLIPPTWRSAFGGRELLLGAETATRGAMGFSLHPTIRLADWKTRPPDQVSASTQVTNGPYAAHPRYSLVGDPCILHGQDRSATMYQRPANFVFCGWDSSSEDRWSPADAANPAAPPGTPSAPGGLTGMTPIDSICAATWIDTPTRYGVVLFGILTWPSEDYPVPHTWYGPSGNVVGDPTKTGCGHGQICPTGNSGTGYYAAGLAPFWWIFDPADLAAGYAGTTPLHAVAPASMFDARAMHGPANADRFTAPTRWYLTGAWFDAVESRLYAAEWGARPTGEAGGPVIHCWQVGAGPVVR